MSSIVDFTKRKQQQPRIVRHLANNQNKIIINQYSVYYVEIQREIIKLIKYENDGTTNESNTHIFT